MKVRLITFGVPSLVRGGVTLKSYARRQRALPLLALLAAHGDRGLSRELAAELLWPGSDAARARHSLDEVVSSTRQLPGCAALFRSANPLALDREQVAVDAWEFEEALAGWHLERAVDLCSGRPFAEGVTIDGATRLEQRLDAARQRYHREYVDTLDRLAQAATERRDAMAVVKWRRLRFECDQLGVAAAERLIEALLAIRERHQARAIAQLHAAFVRQQGDEPDPAILRLLEQLAAGEEGGVSDGPPREGPRATRPEPTEPERAERALARIRGAVGRCYRVDRLLEESTLLGTYAARSESHGGRLVELHVVQGRLLGRTSAEEFQDACRRVARIDHPQVLPVLEAGGDRELLWFATARRPERTLADRLAREAQLPVPEAVAIGRGVAAALASAHAAGVTHGDLRPKFVGLGATGAPVVAFVGLLEALAGGRDDADRSTMLRVGSPVYQSPEQLTGRVHTSPRSDVYALGTLLFEMLVGEPPFGRSRSVLDLPAKLAGTLPAVRARRETVDEPLARVIERCLARVPADRYASAAEVVAALAEVGG